MSTEGKRIKANGVYYDPETDMICLCLGSSIIGRKFKRFLYNEKPIYVESNTNYRGYIYLGML